MDNRTYGKTRNCKGCRFWSEMIARADGGGPVEALCLNPKSNCYSQYVSGAHSCGGWQSGDLGAVDDPDPDVGRSYDAQARRNAQRAA